jgi:universal stress protein A
VAQIETILCPVDFSGLTRPELELAVELAGVFGARLVLHHNLPAAGMGMAKAWEWRAAHPENESDVPARDRLGALLEQVPPEIEVETVVSRGPLAAGVAELARQLPADLVVLGCHGGSGEEHSSLTEQLLNDCDCPLLVIHEGLDRRQTLSLRGGGGGSLLTVLVPTDLSDAAAWVIAYAFRLARRVPMRIRLFHAVAGRQPLMVPVDSTGYAVYKEATVQDARARLTESVPADLADRVDIQVVYGDPREEIVREAASLAPDLIVMGEHARSFPRRFLTRDTSRHVLHRAVCPVWFVPPRRAA